MHTDIEFQLYLFRCCRIQITTNVETSADDIGLNHWMLITNRLQFELTFYSQQKSLFKSATYSVVAKMLNNKSHQNKRHTTAIGCAIGGISHSYSRHT